MDFRLLFSMARRWAWLLVLGALIGAGGAYGLSLLDEPVYQASTKVMVVQPQQSGINADIAQFSDYELVQTYISLLVTTPVLESTSERLGYTVRGDQITSRHEPGTRLMQVTVRSTDPKKAAEIANTIVEVLSEHNDTIQSGRFAAAEESLQTQITQVESQIEAVESEINQRSEVDTESTLSDLEARIVPLQSDIIELQLEIDRLTSLSPEEQERLVQKRLELAEFRLALSVEQNSYNSRLLDNPNARDEATEQRILDLQEDIVRVEQEIEELSDTSVPDDPEVRRMLAEKELTLARLQATLGQLEERYINLTTGLPSATGDESGDETERRSTTLALYQQLRANLLSAYESTRLARLQSTPDVVQVEEATVPSSPVSTGLRSILLRGTVLGLLLASGVVYLIEYLDDTLKSAEEVSRIFGLPVIGFIAESRGNNHEGEVIVAEEPRSPIAEAFRALRTNLEFASVEQPLHTLLVASPNPTDGKTTVATNLAAIMAQGGSHVFLLDADLRRPRVHRQLDLPNRIGLSNVFREQLTVEDAVQSWAEMDNVTVMTSGSLPPNPSELLSSTRMVEILDRAQAMADVVVVDSPPFVVSDAAILASRVDGVLLVLQPGRTTVGAVKALVEQLERADARIVGVVLNRIPRSGGVYYNGYRYQYAGHYYNNGSGQESYVGEPRPGRVRRLLKRLPGVS